MQLDVLDIKGKKTGRSVDLSDTIFGIEPNDHLIYLAVKHYLAGKHRGTHKTKGRSEIAGSTRKLHRQKGTGGSRKGDIKNPLYHGGGTVFGPQPHGYGFKMNRKEKDLAKVSALTYKATNKAIRVVEKVSLEAPKTKTLLAALESLEISGKKVLYVTADYEENLFLSLRNLPRVKGITLSNINTYDIVNSNFLVLTEDAAQILADEEGEATEKAAAAPQEKPATKKADQSAAAKKASPAKAKKTTGKDEQKATAKPAAKKAAATKAAAEKDQKATAEKKESKATEKKESKTAEKKEGKTDGKKDEEQG